MSSVELQEKQQQLDDLQKSFNEYVESSKELEAELEEALNDAADKLDKSAEREALTEQKARNLQTKVDELTKSLQNKPKENNSNGKNLDNEELMNRCRKLENVNEDLQTQVRVLDASVEDLTHQVTGLEEDIIFLKTDLEAITLSRDELETETNQIIEELEKRILDSENERRKLNTDIAEMTKKLLDDPNSTASDHPSDDRVQMLLFKQDKDIDFMKATLDALASANHDAHKHTGGHHDHTTTAQWHEKVDELRKKLNTSDHEKHELQEEIHQLKKKLDQFNHNNDLSNHEKLKENENSFHETEKQLKNEISKLNIELNELKKNNNTIENESNHKIIQLNKNIDDINKEKKELKEQISGLQEHLEALLTETNEIEDLRQQNHTQSNDIQGLNEKLQELELANKDLEEILQQNQNTTNNNMIPTHSTYCNSTYISSSTVHTSIEINNISTTQVTVKQILKSGDKELLTAELLRLAQQYDALRNSNTRMLSKLQALQGNIQVCCRTRPPSYQELAQGGKVCIDAADDTELMCYDGRSEAWKSFVFDRVWRAEANQAEVFADIEPMVLSVLDGYNACILAYGQTGSGKTFTMDGYGEQFGANYRTIQKLFDLLILRKVQAEAHANRVEQLTRESTAQNSRTSSGPAGKRRSFLTSTGAATPSSPKSSTANASDETDDTNSVSSEEVESPFSFSLTVSMMEIYNEQVYDLLSANGGQSSGVSLDIRQGPDSSVSVPGLQQMPVNSLQDVMSVFGRGSANRATASTNLNEHSSRSHLIVQVNVTTQHGSDMPVKGCLNLVDLAGSERVGKSGATGTTMKEAQHINKSLSALGDVMEALDQKSKHIPYRNSKLTYLLQNSLGGNSRTMMIVTVCPTDLTFEESLFTLQFATRVRNISIGPAQKHSSAKNLEVALKTLKSEYKEMKKLKQLADEQIQELKKEQKKIPPSSLMEAKLKTIEEARKAGEILMQQLNKQITECNIKLSDEKELKEQLTTELSLTQKNLKKALEQIKELTKANEQLNVLLKKKELDLEAAMNAVPKGVEGEREVAHHHQQHAPVVADTPSNHRDSFSATANSKPPAAPVAAGNRGIYSSARRVLPSSSSNSALSGPVRKSRPSIMKEFMLPTASSVARLDASAADHERYSEEVSQATHGPLNPTTATPFRAPSPSPRGRRPSMSSSICTDNNSLSDETESVRRVDSLQDLLAPTASRQAYKQATEAELAKKREDAQKATHAGHTRLSVSAGGAGSFRRDSEDGGSVATGRASLTDTSVHFVNPKGHSSWQDAMAPTAARLAAVAAAEEDYNQRSQEKVQATHPIGPRFSVSPASSRGRNDEESINNARLSSEFVNPKGHSSWHDAMLPTASRRASIIAAEEESIRRSQENATATHAVGLGRFAVSPGRSRWEDQEAGGKVRSPNPEYASPKGHSSWVDAMAPTAARQAAIAAAEAEQLAAKEQTHSPTAARPWVPSSKEPGRPPQPTHDNSVGLAAESTRSSSVRPPVRDPSVSRRASIAGNTTPTTAPAPASTGSISSSYRAGNNRRMSTSQQASSTASSRGTAHTPTESVSLLTSSSMVRRSAVATSTTESHTTTTSSTSNYQPSRPPTLSARSEEAMKRHQLRMEKRKEMISGSNTGAIMR